ncbi:MAG: hypothetical protein ACRYFX_30030 [Janthinobacterium lividum]
MASPQPNQQEAVNQVYDYAANLLVHGNKNNVEVEQALVAKGLDAESAQTVVTNLTTEIGAAKKARAKKDMLYGALWCVGGIALTVAHIGFVFWGAIIFGGIQFFKGVANLAD